MGRKSTHEEGALVSRGVGLTQEDWELVERVRAAKEAHIGGLPVTRNAVLHIIVQAGCRVVLDEMEEEARALREMRAKGL